MNNENEPPPACNSRVSMALNKQSSLLGLNVARVKCDCKFLCIFLPSCRVWTSSNCVCWPKTAMYIEDRNWNFFHAPNPNQPQRRSHLVSHVILEAICAMANHLFQKCAKKRCACCPQLYYLWCCTPHCTRTKIPTEVVLARAKTNSEKRHVTGFPSCKQPCRLWQTICFKSALKNDVRDELFSVFCSPYGSVDGRR